MAKTEPTRVALIKHMKKGNGAHPDADAKKLVKGTKTPKRPPTKAKAARGR
jgi:hypothetical protein